VPVSDIVIRRVIKPSYQLFTLSVFYYLSVYLVRFPYHYWTLYYGRLYCTFVLLCTCSSGNIAVVTWSCCCSLWRSLGVSGYTNMVASTSSMDEKTSGHIGHSEQERSTLSS